MVITHSLQQSGLVLIHSFFFYFSYWHIAEQMWILTTYLPLMIGDLVPDDNKEWDCFLILLEILCVYSSCHIC